MFTNSYFLEDNPPVGIANCITSFKKFFDLFNKSYEGKFWIAGGALRSYFLEEKPRDIDIYFIDDVTRKSIEDNLKYTFFANQQFENEHTVAYRINNLNYSIDLIKKNYESPEQTIKSFDLSVAMCATDGIGLYCDQDYFINLATKTSSIRPQETDPAKTLSRIIRYANKGFTYKDDELREFLYRIRNTDDVIGQDEEMIENKVDNSVNSSPVYVDPFNFNSVTISNLSSEIDPVLKVS